jgi:deazaflavin-dependent oxidoreductase (nitroreductase family)
MAKRKVSLQALELEFFRALNRVVEPLVRKGLGSPRLVPTGFVVLESLGRVSGRWRRTPLAATRLGPYVVVSTFRGNRSQWVRNLRAHPEARVWLAGKRRDGKALVVQGGRTGRVPARFPQAMRALIKLLVPFTRVGWAFAVLELI